jgi:excisionase family DNA binding protein
MNRLIDAKELAEYLGVPVPWCWRAARLKRIPAVRCGKYLRFDLKKVISTLEENGNDTSTATKPR